jgi:hypothetical protein
MRFFLIFLIVSLSWLTSCSEDINLNGDFKETAVVYGLLDHADSIHYVKITRAFIGPGNTLEIAKIPDSSYFEDVKLSITEFVGGDSIRTWYLNDTIVTNKDIDGAFYAPEQKVYYFKTIPTIISSGIPGTIQTSTNPLLTSLKPGATYKMKAVINNNQFEVFGETELVNGLNTSALSQNFTFKFADNPSEYTSTSLIISNTGNSFMVNAKLSVEINEFTSNNSWSKSFAWQIGESAVQPNSSVIFSVLGKTFFDIIKLNASNNLLISRRTLKGIEVTITGGAEDLFNYIQVNKPSSSLAQTKPTFTNLTVTNGKRVVGIFSSRQTLKVYKPFFVSSAQAFLRAIDKKSTRELCQGQLTGSLLFCSDHPGDNIVNQKEQYACN